MLVFALSVGPHLEPEANPHRSFEQPPRLAKRVHDRGIEESFPQALAILAWNLLGFGELRIVNRRFATPGTRAVDGGQQLVGTLRAVARRLLGQAELDLKIDEVGHRSRLLIRWRMSSPRRGIGLPAARPQMLSTGTLRHASIRGTDMDGPTLAASGVPT